MAMAKRDYAERLAQAGLQRALVSLHSHEARVSDDQITHFAGGWEKTVEGIDNALSVGIEVHLSHVIHRANQDGLKDFLTFVRLRWGRRVRVRLAFVAPTGDAQLNFTGQVPPLPDVLPAIREGLAYAARHFMRVRFVSYCGIPPCLLAPYETFSDACYAGPSKMPEDHVKTDACRTCIYNDRCPGLWGEYVQHYGDPGLTPVKGRRHLPLAARWLVFG